LLQPSREREREREHEHDTSIMSAYIVVNITVNDPIVYEEYRRRAPASIAKYGGKYLVRGGATAVLEGTWTPKRLVILEFPTVEQASEWWNSPEYAPVKEIRDQCADADMVLVEGLE
jgi:uncharacterized protein (DUF1330 family)